MCVGLLCGCVGGLCVFSLVVLCLVKWLGLLVLLVLVSGLRYGVGCWVVFILLG